MGKYLFRQKAHNLYIYFSLLTPHAHTFEAKIKELLLPLVYIVLLYIIAPIFFTRKRSNNNFLIYVIFDPIQHFDVFVTVVLFEALLLLLFFSQVFFRQRATLESKGETVLYAAPCRINAISRKKNRLGFIFLSAILYSLFFVYVVAPSALPPPEKQEQQERRAESVCVRHGSDGGAVAGLCSQTNRSSLYSTT